MWYAPSTHIALRHVTFLLHNASARLTQWELANVVIEGRQQWYYLATNPIDDMRWWLDEAFAVWQESLQAPKAFIEGMETVLSRIGQSARLSIYLAVANVEAHYANGVAHEAQILEPLGQTPWGLTQYSRYDMGGQLLTFHAK